MWGSFMGYLWFIFDDASKVNNTHALLLFSMSLNDMGERDAKYLLGCRELYIIYYTTWQLCIADFKSYGN